MSSQQHPVALFVADCHFHLRPDDAERHRVDRFVGFLQHAHQADHLFLLGDIFDFWFDYPHFRLKGYDSVLAALDRVREAGTTIHFIGGNHDIWAAAYLSERYGCNRSGDAAIHQLGDRRVFVCHGDGLLAFDWAYNTFRTIVRTRAGIVLAKSFHPEFLYALSTWLSGKSRAATRDEAERIEAKAERWLARNNDADWDLMVMGHVHHQFDLREGPRHLTALSGWFGDLGYGLLQDGKFRHLAFERDSVPDLRRADTGTAE